MHFYPIILENTKTTIPFGISYPSLFTSALEDSCEFVYPTQVSSTFHLELTNNLLFISEQPNRNKMASSFASGSKKEIIINGEVVPKPQKCQQSLVYQVVSYLPCIANVNMHNYKDKTSKLKALFTKTVINNETSRVLQHGFNKTKQF